MKRRRAPSATDRAGWARTRRNPSPLEPSSRPSTDGSTRSKGPVAADRVRPRHDRGPIAILMCADPAHPPLARIADWPERRPRLFVGSVDGAPGASSPPLRFKIGADRLRALIPGLKSGAPSRGLGRLRLAARPAHLCGLDPINFGGIRGIGSQTTCRSSRQNERKMSRKDRGYGQLPIIAHHISGQR